MKKILFAIFACFLLLTACTKQDGSEYVGQWKDKKGAVIEITREGESTFLITQGKKIPLTRNADNTLKFSGGLFGDMVFSYSKKTDSIIANIPMSGVQELVRVK